MRKFGAAVFCAALLLILSLTNALVAWPSHVELDNQNPDANHSSHTIQPSSFAWDWTQKVGGGAGNEIVADIVTDSSGNTIITGTFENTVTIGQTTLSSAGNEDIFVAKMNMTGVWLWAISAGGLGVDESNSVALDSSGNVYITGKHQATAYFGSDSLTASGNADDLFVAKISYNGIWQWVSGANSHSSGTDDVGRSIVVDSNGNAYITGYFERDIDFGSTTLVWEADRDLFVAKIDTWGNWKWATMGGGREGHDEGYSIAIDPQNNIFVTGVFVGTSTYPATFGNFSFDSTMGGLSVSKDMLIAKLSAQGVWISVTTYGGSSSQIPSEILVDSQGNVYCSGYFYSDITVGGNQFNAGGSSDSFVIKNTDQGTSFSFVWIQTAPSTSDNGISSMSFDANGNIVTTGFFRGTISLNPHSLATSGGSDVFTAMFSPNGTVLWMVKAGSGSDDGGTGIGIDTQGNIVTSGFSQLSSMTFGDLELSPSGGIDSFIAKLSPDFDGDMVPDSRDLDDDDDLIVDQLDSCNYSRLGFESTLGVDHDNDGCEDSTEDLDDDNDGLPDTLDSCPLGFPNWIRTNTTDLDMDGCNDASEDLDDDGDGFDDFNDGCPKEWGNSTYSFEKGCLDSDGDSRPDVNDPFPLNSSEWEDTDRDGVGNNSDAFPFDPTQSTDLDQDGYGENRFGSFPDSCPGEYGTSYKDRLGCLDTDGDGVSDLNDMFPNDSRLWQDTDRDGIPDEDDAFPYNPTQWEDTDGDGFGDNPMDANADKFPNDSTQWSDVDGDGYGDNPTGNMPDVFPLDPTQWLDTDGDGYGDNPSGNMPDAFPSDITQWIDQDGDGLGDNQSGLNPDPFLFDSDNDGYNNSEDPLPMYPTPGDRDNDGFLDGEDWDPYDINEWKDTDGDGTGDNADIDDDGDGWDDWDEMRANTDPYDPNDKPVEAWELGITDNIALSAWDLLALVSGFPLAVWIIFGLVTRNARTEAYEERMRNAKSREELEDVATEYERALMIRLIGPHQGIRLERVRAELDDEIELGEVALTGEDDDLGPVVTTPDQTDYTEEELGLQPPEDAEIIVDEKGYEWVDQGDDKWYRHQGENAWIKWET